MARIQQREALFRVSNVSKSFHGNNILSNVHITVNTRDMVVLSGPNGAGKTTLLKLIAGLLRPDVGEIAYALPRSQRTILHDEPMLQSNLTVWENMMYAAMVHEIQRREFEQRATVLLQRYGLWDKRDSFPSSLSFGMGRKASICTAFVTTPRLLLADEPFSGLDSQSLQHFVDDMQQMCEQGGAVVISTHQFEPVANRANRVLRIERGELIEGVTV